MQCAGIESQKHDASIFEYRSLKFYEGSPAQYHPTESPAQKINNGGATQTNTRSDNIWKKAHLIFYRKHENIIANKSSLFTTVICSSYSNILILFSPINYVHYHHRQLLQYPQLYLFIYLFIGCCKAKSRQLQLYKVCVRQMSFIFLLRCIFQVAEVLFMQENQVTRVNKSFHSVLKILHFLVSPLHLCDLTHTLYLLNKEVNFFSCILHCLSSNMLLSWKVITSRNASKCFKTSKVKQ